MRRRTKLLLFLTPLLAIGAGAAVWLVWFRPSTSSTLEKRLLGMGRRRQGVGGDEHRPWARSSWWNLFGGRRLHGPGRVQGGWDLDLEGAAPMGRGSHGLLRAKGGRSSCPLGSGWRSG